MKSDDDNFSYALDGSSSYPVLTVNGTTYRSQNRLLTSDDWATQSSGTSGDNHPTKIPAWVLTMTYDGQQLIVYRNGLVDQVVDIEGLDFDNLLVRGEGFNHKCIAADTYSKAASPLAASGR